MRKHSQWAPFLLLFPLVLTGCGMVSNSSTSSSANGSGSGAAILPITGSVHGGQQPVTGATIQLYAVGSTGYGSTPTALLSTTVTSSDGSNAVNSNSNTGNGFNSYPAGAFTISGFYTCPASNPQVYLVATGGNPGLAAGTNNSAIVLMSGLTDCTALKNNAATTVLNINEVTTVASAYALSQFIDPATGNIGGYSYSPQGILNATATIGNLVSTATGTARSITPGGTGAVPQAEINTLANILTPCINTTLPSSTSCTSLFTAAKPASSAAPTNTFLAAIDIARNPANNVATLFSLSTANAAFQPTLPSAPNDWTMALDFAGTNGGNQDLAIDATGGVWITAFASGGSTSSVTRVNNLGVKSFFDLGNINGGGGYSAYALALDLNGIAWIANNDPTTPQISVVNPNGNTIAGPYHYTETTAPNGVAVDGNNNIWVTNSGSSSNSVTEISQNGGANNTSNLSPNNTGFTGGGLVGPDNIAIDAEGDAWVTDFNNGSGNSLTMITPSQTVTQITGGALQAPAGIAVDGNDNVWVADYFSGSTTVSAFHHNGTPLSASGFTGGGIHNPISIAVDGASNIWIANESSAANSISELNSSGTPLSPATTGFQGGAVGNLKFPWTLKVDSSGNIWVGNAGSTPITVTSGSANANLTEFIGLGAPTITPLAQAVENKQIGKVPGTPIPVSILSPTLPYYSLNVNYYATLFATGGNSGAFTWSLNSGSLPLGMSLGASGSITGSSSATGTTTFQVKACDAAASTNCATQTVSMTASSSLPLAGGESMLNGRYIMRLGGFNNGTVTGSGLVNGYAVVQSMVFDGAGHITAVSEDFNNPNSHSTLAASSSGTGSYTLGTDHRGIMIFNYSGITLEYAFSVGNLNGSSIAQDMRMIEFDNTRPAGAHPYGTAAGLAKLQTATTLSTNQAWVFGMQGETPCTLVNSNGCTNGVISPYGAVSAAGRFFTNASNGVTGGVEDAGANSNSYNGVTFTGTYTTPDANGRGTMTLTSIGTLFPDAPSNFVYYVVSPTELYILSLDSHTNFTLLSGDVLAQTTNFTPSSLLSGNLIGYESSPNNGDGVSFYPNASGASLIFLAATPGVQTVSAVVEEDDSSTLKLARQQGTFGYSIDTNGRFSLGPNGSGTPVFYFANSGQAFGTEQPSGANSGDTGLLTIEQQTSGTYTCTAPSGTYSFGIVQPPVPLGVSSGSLLQNGTGTGTITLDNSDPSGILTQGASESFACTAADIAYPNGTTGRFSYTTGSSNSIGYAINANRTALMTTTPGNPTPTILIVQK